MTKLLKNATVTGDTIKIPERLSMICGEKERLIQQNLYLTKLVDYTSFSLSLTEVEAYNSSEKMGPFGDIFKII